MRAALAPILLPLLLVACTGGGNFGGSGTAKVRVVNVMFDGGAVTLTVYQTPLVTGLAFEGIAPYQNVDAGNRPIEITSTSSGTVLYRGSDLLADQSAHTFLVYGTSASPAVRRLTDAVAGEQPPAAGTFTLRVDNSAAGTAGFDVYVTPPGASLADLSPNFTNVGYGKATSSSVFNAAALRVRFTLPNSKQVVYDSGTVTFAERTAYEIIGYTRGSSTLVNAVLLANDKAGTGSVANSLLAQMKVVHAALGTGAINAFVDGTLAFGGVPYRSASAYAAQPSGARTVTVDTVTSPGAVIASLRTSLVPATDASVVVFGPPGAQAAKLYADTNMAGAAGNARLRFVNAATDVGPVDVLVNFAVKVPSLVAQGASAYLETAEDTYAITFDRAGTTSAVATAPAVPLGSGHTYTVYLVGSAGQYDTIVTRDD